jgi:NADPH:quinone reductase-like Zn-dependent oxidoreductase
MENVPLPTPESDEIREKCLVAALNPVDAKVRNWKGMLLGMSPITLG